jgi:hypothetical protein
VKAGDCWRCGSALQEPWDRPISFRAQCDACGSWVHCCLGCQNYTPGKPNDCAIPDTDPIRDREAINFCEFFCLLGHKRQKGEAADHVTKRLFGEEPSPDKKTRLEDLFSD